MFEMSMPVTGGVDKDPADPTARAPLSQGSPNVQNTNF